MNKEQNRAAGQRYRSEHLSRLMVMRDLYFSDVAQSAQAQRGLDRRAIVGVVVDDGDELAALGHRSHDE